MNVIRRIRSRLAALLDPDAGQKRYLGAGYMEGLPLTKFSDYSSYLHSGLKKVWAHWKAADIVAEAVSQTQMSVTRNGQPANQPELARLLEVANDEMTFVDLIYLLVMHIKFTGNAFVYMQTNGGRRPVALHSLNPKRVEIVPNSDGTLRGYLLSVGNAGKKVPFEPEEVMHFMRPHPDNDFWGLGETEAGESMLQESVNRADWSGNFWKNGAAPSGVLVEKSDVHPNPLDFDKAKAKFTKEYSGRENSGKLAWLIGKWEYVRLGLTQEEMQSIESQKWTVEQIFMLHGVPLSVANAKEAANYATASIDEVRFRKYTVGPMVRRISDTLSSDLAPMFGSGLEIKFMLSSLENIVGLMEGVAPAFDRGILSINEAREILGLAADRENEEWEKRFIMGSLVPLEFAGEAQADMAASLSAQRMVERLAVDNSGNGNGKHEPDLLSRA